MIGTLIKKDLARLRVNWRNLLILLAMPLCITGLVGTVFGPAARSGEMPRIKMAIVNEDENFVGGMFAGIASSDQSQEFLESIVTDRNEAMRLINENMISAVVIIPTNFSSKFLASEPTPSIELIKNPAQSYMPAITEELLRVVSELLNAVSQNLTHEAPEILEILEEPGAPQFKKLTKIVARVGKRFERAEEYVFPPIIGFHRSQIETKDRSQGASNGLDIFAFVMPGLAAIFLLFTAEGTARDLFVEKRTRTLDRFRTLNGSLWPFLTAKAIYSIIVVLIAAAIMLIGGGLIFDISWTNPLAISSLTLTYAVFCNGFSSLLVAIVYREQLASILNTVVIMFIGFLGGSMMPTQNLPSFIRDTISPWMPNYIFAEAIKRLQFGFSGPPWTLAATELLLSGIVMLIAASYLLRRRLLAGES